MAKTFYTSGTGSQQTLTGSQNEKVAVYQTLADAEADLANLEAGQIVATPDTGDELAQPVDVVALNNMHSVTSNAVANAIAVAGNHKIDEYVRNDIITAPASGWRSCCWMFPKKGKYLVEVYRDKVVTTNIQKIENNVTTSYETRGTDYMRYAIIETTVDRAQVQIAGNFTEGVTYNLVLRLTQIKYD